MRMDRRQLIRTAALSGTLLRLPDGFARVRQEGTMMNVIPAPRAATTTTEGSLTISAATPIVVADPSLQPVAEWFAAEVARLARLDIGGTNGDNPAISFLLDPGLEARLATSGASPNGEALDRERYRLQADAGGARISAPTVEGAFRGATTLLHLVAAGAGEGTATIEAVDIVDAPRFGWRGLSFDVVRTFHPVSTVKKVIDLLALYKLNVLHLHLTDSEGWRFEVPAYPNLAEIAGQTARNGRPGGWYTQEEYAAIVAYAAARFVTIVPEFDSPGHTASVLRAYPELGTPEILATPEAMQYLHPGIEDVWELVTAVYDEMARVHPGAWLHIGGDEAIAMDEETYRAYMDRAMPAARRTGKGVVAWQESARAGFSDGDLMQYWIPPHLVQRVRDAVENPDGSWIESGFPDPAVRDAFVALFLQAPEDLPKAVDQGAMILLSRADKLYLDTRYVEPSADPAQADDHQRLGMQPLVYGSGTVRESYDWSPETLEQDLDPSRIAGVEAAIWCETIDDEHDLMFQLLPRLPGIAEKAWGDERDWEDYRPRLAVQRGHWDAMGLTYFVSSVVWPEG